MRRCGFPTNSNPGPSAPLPPAATGMTRSSTSTSLAPTPASASTSVSPASVASSASAPALPAAFASALAAIYHTRATPGTAPCPSAADGVAKTATTATATPSLLPLVVDWCLTPLVRAPPLLTDPCCSVTWRQSALLLLHTPTQGALLAAKFAAYVVTDRDHRPLHSYYYIGQLDSTGLAHVDRPANADGADADAAAAAAAAAAAPARPGLARDAVTALIEAIATTAAAATPWSVHVYARAAPVYLFPGSQRLPTKHPRGAADLAGWWMSVLDAAAVRAAAEPSAWVADWLVPAYGEAASATRGILAGRRPALRLAWTWGGPWRRLGVARGVPQFPDDAKTKTLRLLVDDDGDGDGDGDSDDNGDGDANGSGDAAADASCAEANAPTTDARASGTGTNPAGWRAFEELFLATDAVTDRSALLSLAPAVSRHTAPQSPRPSMPPSPPLGPATHSEASYAALETRLLALSFASVEEVAESSRRLLAAWTGSRLPSAPLPAERCQLAGVLIPASAAAQRAAAATASAASPLSAARPLGIKRKAPSDAPAPVHTLMVKRRS
ncbi:hypothetical protein CXG81DRAFT_21104 [Caulochytrium protostelioides]|uniref:histone acetyltransferase n=1 Tax=Caulochytrium protostelioides TaxID=1555241 RepID=A0A4P9X0Z0_9FUNG|nr:hypothetical protein CXG81DRAFT_21104 [Caulochytrium protostelioides]|eukprot:RKO98712.1 hypothetical protein CXG81DRAFT_21104 [Caulochytrium protostelioides]